jgi:hypothetical protein
MVSCRLRAWRARRVVEHGVLRDPTMSCGFDRWLTLVGNVDAPTISPSIKVTHHDGRVCHSFVRAGRFEYCGDSHALAGQSVPVSVWPEDFHDGDHATPTDRERTP